METRGFWPLLFKRGLFIMEKISVGEEETAVRCEVLDGASAPRWAACIPPELFRQVMVGRLRALGAIFLGKPQGALVWEPGQPEGTVHSIYVRPAARRLGLATALVAELGEEMARAGCNRVWLTYARQGARTLLDPFLLQAGFSLAAETFPLGTATLEETADALARQRITPRSGGCATLEELTKGERFRFSGWLREQTGLSLYHYVEQGPASYVLMDRETPQGALLFRGGPEGLSLDYCWVASGRPSALAKLLARAIGDLCRHYPPETPLDMILSTPQGEGLYTHLLGQPTHTITLCRGGYAPLPRWMLGGWARERSHLNG